MQSMPSDDRKNFIYYIVNEKQEKMSSIVSSLEKSNKRYRKATRILNIFGTACGSISIGTTSASFATALSGVGVVMSIPLSIVSASLGLISVTCNGINEKLHGTLEKKETLLHIAKSYRINMEQEIGRALSDSKIDSDEYKMILFIYQDFVNKYYDNSKSLSSRLRSSFRNMVKKDGE